MEGEGGKMCSCMDSVQRKSSRRMEKEKRGWRRRKKRVRGESPKKTGRVREMGKDSGRGTSEFIETGDSTNTHNAVDNTRSRHVFLPAAVTNSSRGVLRLPTRQRGQSVPKLVGGVPLWAERCVAAGRQVTGNTGHSTAAGKRLSAAMKRGWRGGDCSLNQNQWNQEKQCRPVNM